MANPLSFFSLPTMMLRRGVAKAPPAKLGLSFDAAHEVRDELYTTLRRLETSEHGLTAAEAANRLAAGGANEVAHEKQPHWLLQLLATFKNPFILILAALAAISLILEPDELKGPLIIGTMIVISVVLRFWQEFRSTRAAEALKAMVRTTATVIRRDSESAPPDPP